MEALPEKNLTGSQRPAFSRAKRAAVMVVQRRFRVLRLVREAYTKLASHHGGPLEKVRGDITLLLRLARAWATREYRTIPWRALIYVTAALIYFVNPADLLPDVLVGLGFVDDAAVVAAVVRALERELQAFRAWEEGRRLNP